AGGGWWLLFPASVPNPKFARVSGGQFSELRVQRDTGSRRLSGVALVRKFASSQVENSGELPNRDTSARPSVWLCAGLRFVREGANALLPLAQIGGDFIGARCLTLRGVRGTLAAASVIVDVLMQAVSQLIFALIGLVLLIAIGGNELIVWPVAVGLALALPALGGLLVMQGHYRRRLVKCV